MHTNHNPGSNSKERPLLIALILTFTFLVVEVVGGIFAHSLALISDAAHMLTDVAALAIALLAIKIGKQSADSVRTFGYYRYEILAAAFNAILLFLVSLYILYEAYQRLGNPPEIQSITMLLIASIGLIINLIAMRLLMAGKDQSLNLKSAYIEVWSDALGSVGVIIGAILIYFTQWSWIDSIIAVLICVWVLPRTWTLLKECTNVLLEGVPTHIDLNELKQAVYDIDGVLDLHELHVWTITSDKVSLTAHVVIDPSQDFQMVLSSIRERLNHQFNIAHITLQHETSNCLVHEQNCFFDKK